MSACGETQLMEDFVTFWVAQFIIEPLILIKRSIYVWLSPFNKTTYACDH